VEDVIYRNLKGFIKFIDFKWWKSFADRLGIIVYTKTTKNSTYFTIYRGGKSVSFTINRLGSANEIILDYMRLESEDTPLAILIDCLIYHLKLSGEKTIVKSGSIIKSTYFDKGIVVNLDYEDPVSQFELYLIKETIFGYVHLALDKLIEARRAGDLVRIKQVKESLLYYQAQLAQLNEQLQS
jgi:hypothetical protein